MKISVCGKGGSGKSSIVTLLANEARNRDYRVLVVDSDESNLGLSRMLGFDRAPVPLMELVGGKRGLKQKMNQPQVLAQAEIWLRDIPSEHMLEKNRNLLGCHRQDTSISGGMRLPYGGLEPGIFEKTSPER